jgi:hypothetical protein
MDSNVANWTRTRLIRVTAGRRAGFPPSRKALGRAGEDTWGGGGGRTPCKPVKGAGQDPVSANQGRPACSLFFLILTGRLNGCHFAAEERHLPPNSVSPRTASWLIPDASSAEISLCSQMYFECPVSRVRRPDTWLAKSRGPAVVWDRHWCETSLPSAPVAHLDRAPDFASNQ